MERQNQQEFEIEIVEIYRDTSTIVAKLNGQEGEYTIVPPANINYIKSNGKFKAKFNPNGYITYIAPVKAAFNPQYPPRQFTPKPNFTPKQFTQTNPLPASNYKPEDSESKYVTLIKEYTDRTLAEIRIIYNGISLSKWIVASNIFPKSNGKYDLVMFIKEKREGLDIKPYMEVDDMVVSNNNNFIKKEYPKIENV
jgi:hypothetical protein